MVFMCIIKTLRAETDGRRQVQITSDRCADDRFSARVQMSGFIGEWLIVFWDRHFCCTINVP